MPILLWKMLRFGKYKQSLLFRLGIKKVKFLPASHRIWIHANSVGEVVAASSIYQKIVDNYPHYDIVVSCNTETGLANAKQIFPKASHFFYLPIDLSYLMKNLVKRVNASLLIISEGDYWFHLFKQLKKTKGKIVVINGKISEKSFQRFVKFTLFSKQLFNCIDGYCLQSNEDRKRFLSLGVDSKKLQVLGSVKFDNVITLLNTAEKQAFRKMLQIKDSERVITVGSTHTSEERLLLDQLSELRRLDKSLVIILVPRHLERVPTIVEEITEPVTLLSDLKRGVMRESSIILIDSMGVLTTCYQISELAIVGGSFVQGVGGHNILEPIQCSLPVFFGPYMQSQKVLASSVIIANAGLQLDVSILNQKAKEYLDNDRSSVMRKAGKRLLDAHQGVSDKTFVYLENLFLKMK